MTQAQSFFFYDLETSGFNPRTARIMQFAGQRTGLDLKPIGKPVNVLIKITEDILPDPQAIMVTGITPQQTLSKGITEAEFLNRFDKEVSTPGTIFVGYNTVRFDDEFMRFLHYRNFYDPYEWEWQDGKSRWDLLDVVRMTRALRPDGIKWPVDEEGRPTNRLELLTKLNNLDHANAHDALSDVMATISVAKLIKSKQPALFKYLLKMRQKTEINRLVHSGQAFIYTSGKYPGEYEKTTVVSTLADHPDRQAVLVYDLRYDPEPFSDLSAEQLVETWKYKSDSHAPRLPIKTLQFNRCPAVAPLSVLKQTSAKQLKHLQLDLSIIEANHQKLKTVNNWPERIFEALKLLDDAQEKRYRVSQPDVDSQLYNGFFDNADKKIMAAVRSANPGQLDSSNFHFKDKRLAKLLPLYKARNFPETLSNEEMPAWKQYCIDKLKGNGEDSQAQRFADQLEDLLSTKLTAKQQVITKDLQAYVQQIMPGNDGV